MKKIILSLAVAAALMVGVTACNSTRNVDTTDSTTIDSTQMMQDTIVTDTNNRKLPDTLNNSGSM